MLLAYDRLKKMLPALNEEVITPEMIFAALEAREVECREINIEEAGYFYISPAGREYVFLKHALHELLFHETLAFEVCHLYLHYPASFLFRKQQLEAETLSLCALMPLRDLPRLNRVKGQLDEESFDLLARRNRVNETWQI